MARVVNERSCDGLGTAAHAALRPGMALSFLRQTHFLGQHSNHYFRVLARIWKSVLRGV
jgi:hypothetical protein